MKTKIIIATILLLLTLGVCAAKDVNDFKIPMEFSEKTTDGVYQVPGATDTPTFIILKTDDTTSYDHNETGYMIFPTGEVENTYYYIDTDLNEQGCMEVIEVDGEKFLVFSQYSNGVKNPGYLGAALLSIEDFNENNNVNPIPL